MSLRLLCALSPSLLRDWWLNACRMIQLPMKSSRTHSCTHSAQVELAAVELTPFCSERVAEKWATNCLFNRGIFSFVLSLLSFFLLSLEAGLLFVYLKSCTGKLKKERKEKLKCQKEGYVNKLAEHKNLVLLIAILCQRRIACSAASYFAANENAR